MNWGQMTQSGLERHFDINAPINARPSVHKGLSELEGLFCSSLASLPWATPTAKKNRSTAKDLHVSLPHYFHTMWAPVSRGTYSDVRSKAIVGILKHRDRGYRIRSLHGGAWQLLEIKAQCSPDQQGSHKLQDELDDLVRIPDAKTPAYQKTHAEKQRLEHKSPTSHGS